ncbi:hypothetical protein [Streptomyces sp. S1]|uniref:hypothetical protein n=1 Tax=Streptomyces sp. S1 TaxID=718288 RepID=UPI003D711227
MEPTEEEAMGSCCTPDHGCSTGADGTTTGAEPDGTAITAITAAATATAATAATATADDGAGREPAGRA